MTITRALTTLVILLAPASALALPQFAVRSARACDTCHVDPTGWEDPALEFRKCSLNCNTCHVSPSGGGMRNAAGLYYGRQTLPMFGSRPADEVYRAPDLSEPPGAASSQPMASGSQPMASPSSQPMASPSSQPMASPSSQPMASNSQPMAAGSQPAGALAASQPAGPPRGSVERSYPHLVPAPGTAGRYGGIEVNPDFQIGADLRLMTFIPVEPDSEEARADEVQFFPMQADIYLAYRPYNPAPLNEGRLTLLLNAGVLGARAEQFDGMGDRIFVREWYAMYHDLPYQAYVRAGRFLPAWGWKTDDHTPFVRQGQLILGQPFDHERQVTGVEVGINPNYLYAHFALFNAPDHPMSVGGFDAGGADAIWTGDGAYGAALAAGWRDLAWQLGGGIVYGNRGAIGDPEKAEQYDQVAYSAEWAVNFDVLAGKVDLPLVYLGQYTLNHRVPEAGRNTVGLAALHELDYLIVQGVNATVRYDWQDSDVELRFDSLHRLSFGFDYHPIRYVELNLRYRHHWTNTDDRFAADADEVIFIAHAWY
ncbi:MAG: hypothetical protein R3F65_19840 [bacterium]